LCNATKDKGDSPAKRGKVPPELVGLIGKVSAQPAGAEAIESLKVVSKEANYDPQTKKLTAVKKEPIQPKSTLEVPLADQKIGTMNVDKVFGAGTIQNLKSKYPTTVVTDYRTMTVGDFANKYKLTLPA
jgi:hypothetical protein